MTLASAARAYSERLAWAVLPLRGKVPAIPKGRGYLDATTDPATISRWWREYPDANVGVSCIGSNLVVLDVDPRHGGDRTLAEFEEREHGNTLLALSTGSGKTAIAGLFLGEGAAAHARSRFLVTQQVDPERFPGVIETDYIILDFAGAAQRHGSALRRRGFDGEFLTKYEASCLLNLAWNRGAIQRTLARAGG